MRNITSNLIVSRDMSRDVTRKRREEKNRLR
nr:MAG TPA: hypothetical protein [Caudoviricetes sp.]